jgi:hypothetical protein
MSTAHWVLRFNGKDTEPIPIHASAEQIKAAIKKAFGDSYVPGEGVVYEADLKGKR